MLTPGPTMLTRRAVLAGLAAIGLPTMANGQSFPSHAITIIVPYPPGGPVDALARAIAQDGAGELGQSIVVDNRPGGSGIIGTNAVARAEADGHTLVLGTNQTRATNQSLIRNCPYDAVKDFAPVAGIAAMPHVLVVRKNLAVASVGEVVAIAKARPGSLTFGSIGNGSGAHLAAELFKAKAAIDMLHVPFKGLSPMLTELLADRIDMSIAPLPGLIGQQIESGAVRALGIASAQRAPQLAAVPTFAEAGVSGVEADAWSALFAPAKTSPAVVDRLYRMVAEVLSKESVRATMAKQGIPLALRPPEAISAMLPGEVAKWAAVIKAANVVME
jgi:tripartite-type tricarboxylate transporter receptor subunit TctC